MRYNRPSMKIIFAQGNPGSKYEQTRHNAGFILIEKFAYEQSAEWRPLDKFKARVAETAIAGEKVLLVQPQTFYNDTGLAAQSLIHFYKLDSSKDFLVIHDDLALPLGTIRVRQKGSDAGNNGIKSLNAHLGPDYTRIRVGIWTPDRDLHGDMNFVLGTFTQTELEKLKKDVMPVVHTLIQRFVQGDLESVSETV
jgi:PTH1 family peptidyl-tRNA hydrolase